MEVTVERKPLADGLKLLQSVADQRATVPVLSHLLVEAGDEWIALSATDLEVGLRMRFAARVVQGGKATVPARKFSQSLNGLDAEQATLRLDGDRMVVEAGRSRFKMLCLDPRSFPVMDEIEDARARQLPFTAAQLADVIRKTIFAVSADAARYNLSGVMLRAIDGGVIAAATDGHRLAEMEVSLPGAAAGPPAIVPRKGLAQILKLLEFAPEDSAAALLIDARAAACRIGAGDLVMRLAEGEFPDYQGAVPRETRLVARVACQALTAALRRAAVFATPGYNGVTVRLEPNTLAILASSELGDATDVIDAGYSGEPFSIGFNAHYLLEALETLPDDSEVTLGLNDEASAGLLTAAGTPGFKYVVMPVRP